jgi:pyruvate formate lyase activating enzyme
MLDAPATPITTLVRARSLALKEGLRHVYTGNVHNIEGDTSFCPRCAAPLVVRDWYLIKQYRLDAQGRCPDCSATLAGRFAAHGGHFGRQRIPITVNSLRRQSNSMDS